MKRLPDAEFSVTHAIWGCEGSVTSNIIMDLLGKEEKWKV